MADRETVRTNAFDALRLAAAVAVLVSHNFAVLGRPEPMTATGHTLGAIAVLMFFSISGYLVCESLQRSSTVLSFAIKRALRIYPALLVALVFSAVVIGPLATTLPLGTYFTDETTWRQVLRFFGVPGEDRLPGVFEGNPYPVKVNASLWTIKHEIACYVLLALVEVVLRAFGLGQRRHWLILSLFGLFVTASAYALMSGRTLSSLLAQTTGVSLSASAEFFIANFASFAAAFFLGAYFAERGHAFHAGRALVVASAAILLASTFSPHVAALVPMAVCVLAIWAGNNLPQWVNVPLRGQDLSYGVYIYAFPIQQAVVHFAGGEIRYPVALTASLALTLLLAAQSWRLVEKPALALKRHLSTPRRSDSPATALSK